MRTSIRKPFTVDGRLKPLMEGCISFRPRPAKPGIGYQPTESVQQDTRVGDIQEQVPGKLPTDWRQHYSESRLEYAFVQYSNLARSLQHAADVARVQAIEDRRDAADFARLLAGTGASNYHPRRRR